MNKFAVSAGYMTESIYVGRVSQSGHSFLQKEEATDMVLAAVAQYVMRNFAHPDTTGTAGMHTTFPGLGLELEVKVWPVGEKPVSGNQKESES